jgi:putative transport protein
VVDLLADSPTLLLFVVAALGFLLARIRFRGFSLGVAAVLFAGIAVGAIDPRLQLPEALWTLGLSIFVYSIGISSGPGFVASIRRRGVGANALVLGAVSLAALVALAGDVVTKLSGATITGVFTGALTNTPALAAAIESLKGLAGSGFDEVAADPIVGYSLAYPIGVLGPLLATTWLLARSTPAGPPALVTRTAVVERDDLPTLGELAGHDVTFGRLVRSGAIVPATPDLRPQPGDLVTVVGERALVAEVVARLGAESDEHAELDRHGVDFRRVVVSSRAVAGRRIGDLDVGETYGATITRVRRGDVDLLADPALTLELGDRVRVVAARDRMGAVSTYFGDSMRALGEVDVLTFSVGIAAGLLLGSIPVPLGGGNDFSLGFAGGPLVVGIVLGALGRTGPLVWQMPYTANLTLRQLGTIMFLAGVGTRAGDGFAATVANPDSLVILALAAVVTAVPLVLTLVVGLRVLRLSAPTLAGVLAGVCTQPAVLAYASEKTADDPEVNVGYATVYPLAMIAKIVVAQVLLALTY